MTRVQMNRVSKVYPERGKGGGEVVAVDEVSIDVASGEIHAVIGYSGAGKSTLLRLVNGLERASSGTILLGESDRDLVTMPERELRGVRRDIGMIFQQFNLFHSKTVAGNVEYPLIAAGMARDARRERVAQLLDYVGLGDRAEAHAEQLSGGQKQRVGIARALATQPGLILADEATSALDPETSHEVLELLRRVNREFGVTILLITHEMDVVRRIAQRVTVMDRGRAVEQGDVFDVFSRPATETTRRFVATALPTEPGAELVRELRRIHHGRLISVTLRDGGVEQPAIFGALAERGVGVSIVHGGITDVGGRSFGRLTLELTGEELQVEHAIAALGQRTELEVLA